MEEAGVREQGRILTLWANTRGSRPCLYQHLSMRFRGTRVKSATAKPLHIVAQGRAAHPGLCMPRVNANPERVSQHLDVGPFQGPPIVELIGTPRVRCATLGFVVQVLRTSRAVFHANARRCQNVKDVGKPKGEAPAEPCSEVRVFQMRGSQGTHRLTLFQYSVVSRLGIRGCIRV